MSAYLGFDSSGRPLAGGAPDCERDKPHWRKAPTAPPRPKPDPGQGARKTPAEVNFATADRADWEAEMRKYGVRPRT